METKMIRAAIAAICVAAALPMAANADGNALAARCTSGAARS